MSDLIGCGFVLFLIIGAVVGLRILSKPKRITAEDFERNVAEGPTALGASMNALQEILDPAAGKSKEVLVQMKDGRFQKKKGDGKTIDENEDQVES